MVLVEHNSDFNINIIMPFLTKDFKHRSNVDYLSNTLCK